jgi:hypothetical protein
VTACITVMLVMWFRLPDLSCVWVLAEKADRRMRYMVRVPVSLSLSLYLYLGGTCCTGVEQVLPVELPGR